MTDDARPPRPGAPGAADPAVGPVLRSAAVSSATRLALTSSLPAFASLPGPALERLAGELREERYPVGAVVLTEDDVGDRFYLVVDGRAEVSTRRPDGAVVLATVGPGETFGEIALLRASHQRAATITALTDLVLLSLGADDFHHTLRSFPAVASRFSEIADTLLRMNFLKQATPFASLNASRMRRLAARLQEVTVSVGDTVIRQGEPGDTCYVVRSGAVEVLQATDGASERRLAMLHRGALFGEGALLTDAPRNASVRAVEPTELLALRRADLMEAIAEEPDAGLALADLVRIRDRPRRADGIVSVQQSTIDRETITILKDPSRGAYYRLSAEGWFLWQRLDGEHTLRDLTVEYFLHFKALAPHVIVELVGGLARAGFVRTRAVRADVLPWAGRAPAWQRWALRARGVMEWNWTWRGVDRLAARLYAGGAYLLYTRPGLLLLAIIGVGGLIAFFSTTRSVLHAEKLGGLLLLFLIPARLCSVVLHEGAHALTTKAFGRTVGGAGVGWYWFGPIAFVDTSDMWLAARGPRIAVSLAGACADVVLAGAASLVALVIPSPAAGAVLWQFALLSYLAVLINSNPLLEYDGYYVLTDLLDRPNLRHRALLWIGRDMVPALRSRRLAGLHGHRLEVLYGFATLLYVGVLVALTVVLYRLLLEDWLSARISPWAAAGLVWALAAAVVAVVAAAVVSDLRGVGMRHP
ncbi:MAG TPA: cyclic nucleotide-binding domain-containing protein [Methylomirabilota bacterium]|jgi:CRP-like cAMP-binding protein